MFERWLAGVIGIMAIGAGLAIAVLPFSFVVGSGEGALTIEGGPPIVSAWSSVRRGPVAVSAVSDATSQESVEVRSGGRPYAAREARTRLLGAIALLAGGTLAIVFARRRRRPSRWASPSLPPPSVTPRRPLPDPEWTSP